MEYGRLGNFLDSIQLFRAQVNELHLQQHHICRESIGILAALYDLPVSISSVKRWQGTTRSFQTNEAEEQCRNVDGKENNLAGGSHSKSSAKPPAKSSRRRRKPLVDSQVVNQPHQLDTSSPICTRMTDVRDVDEDVALQQQQTTNEGLGHSVEVHNRGNERPVHSEEGSNRENRGNQSTFLVANENEEPIHSVEEKRRTSTSNSHIIVAGEAGELREPDESLPHLEKPRESSVSIGGRISQVKTEVALDLDAPRLTRSRARILQNAGANVTIARGEPPQRKRRGRKGNANSSDLPAAVEEDEIAGKIQTTIAQIAVEQQGRDERPSKKPPAGKKRNNRASAETNGEVSKSGAAAEEQDVRVVKMENGPPQATGTAEEDEKERAEGRPSKKSKTSLESTRLTSSSLAECNAFELDKVENASVNEHASVEDRNHREGSAAKRSRGNANATILPSSVEIDGIVGMFETVGINQNEGTYATAAGDQIGKTLHPFIERNRREVSHANMITPSSQKRITRASSRSPAEMNGEVGKNGVIGEEQHMKVVKIGSGPTETTRTAEEDEEEDRVEARPSKKSRASLGISRMESSSQAEANDLELDKLENASGNAYASAEDHNGRELSVTKRLRESNGNASAIVLSSSVEVDGIVGKLKTVGLHQNQGMLPTAAADQLGNTLLPLKERNGMESPQANVITPWSQNDLSVTKRMRKPNWSPSPTVLPSSVEVDGIVGKLETVGLNQNQGMLSTAAADQLGNTLLPLKERNGMESPQANVITPWSQNELSVTKRLREPNWNPSATVLPSSVEVDGIVGKLETVGLNKNQGMLSTAAADQLGNTLLPLKERYGMESPQANVITPWSQNELSVTKRLREPNWNPSATVLPSPVEIDGIVGKLETVGLNKNQDMLSTAAADQLGNTLLPLKERNGMESPQANVITPSSQNGNAGELRMNCGWAMTSKVDLEDPDHVKPLRADRGLLLDCTDLSSECLASAEDPPQSLLKQGAYRGSRRTTLLLSPALKIDFVERGANVIVLDHPELKDEHTSYISEVVDEEQMEVQNPPQPLGECHPGRFLHLLAETDANSSRKTKGVAYSGREHSLAVEVDTKENKMDPTGAGSAKLQLTAVREVSERIAETDYGMPLLEGNISPRDRDGDVVCLGEFHSSSETAFQFPDSVTVSESNVLPGQPPQTHTTHRSSAGTPIRRERRLTELVITTAELHRKELVCEESDRVRTKERLTLLLTAAEVHQEELVDVEAGADVPCSQLKINEGKHLFETSAVRDSQRGRNSHTTSDVSHRVNRREGELKVIIPLAVDVNPSVDQVGRKETTESLENRHMNVASVIPSVQVASSNIVNAQKPFSNLIAGMKSFVPVVQQPIPSFIPDGKRVVKVKALIAAEAAKRAEEEKRDGKDWQRKMMRRAEDNPSLGIERKEAPEASIPLKESVEGIKFDGGESSCGSQMSPRKHVLLLSNSRNLCSAEAKSKHATNLEIEKKVKKNMADLKRMEEERKRKLLASRQLKEQLVQKKMEERQEILKQKKEQKLVSEQEDKAQRHQASEEAEREKKAMEEKFKSKQCTPRPREKLQVEELKVRGTGKGVLQTGQTPGKIRSNLFGAGTLSLRSAVRVPVVSKDRHSKDKQTATMVAAAIQKKGRHPSSSSSSSKLLSMNAEHTRLPSWNAESARLPSLNAEPARLSSLNVQCAAKSGPQNSTHAFGFGNRPADVQQGRIGDSVSYSGTPCSRAVEKAEDLGPMSYDISPYRGSSDDESEDETRPAKHIPFWARKENLEPHLHKQVTIDPDEIFSGWKTCSLKEVFGKTGSKKIEDFGKRSGSGDWFRDRVSWKEELQYKIEMGYVQHTNP